MDLGTAVAAVVAAVVLIVLYILPSLTDPYRVVSAVIVGAALVFAGLSWGGYIERWRTAWGQWRRGRSLRRVLPGLVAELDAIQQDARTLFGRDETSLSCFSHIFRSVTERARAVNMPDAGRLDAMRLAWTETRDDWDAASMEIWRLCRGEARGSLEAYEAALDLLKSQVQSSVGLGRWMITTLRQNPSFVLPGNELDQFDAFRDRVKTLIERIQHLLRLTEAVLGEAQLAWIEEPLGALNVRP
jgi:hypothetical protein